MKSSEAKPLNAEELSTLRYLFQRWVLCSCPYKTGKDYTNELIVAYHSIAEDAEAGKMSLSSDELTQERIAKYGEEEF